MTSTTDKVQSNPESIIQENFEFESKDPELKVLASIIQSNGLLNAQQQYLITRLLGQINYMQNKADKCKKEHIQSRMFAICGGVIVTTLVGLSAYFDNPNLQKGLSITAFFASQIVTVSTAIEQLKKNNELWMFYRRSGEFMKSQMWQFIETAGPYEGLDVERSFKYLIKQTEEIIPRDLDILSSQRAQDNQQSNSINLSSQHEQTK